MNPENQSLLKHLNKNEPLPSNLLKSVTSALPFNLPTDYLEVMAQMNGAEGFVGGSYLRLYPLDNLAALNQAYAADEFAPGLFIFGSNGGGEAFAFDTRESPVTIVQIPFIPMEFIYMESLGTAFRDLLIALSKEVTGVEQAGSSINPLLLGKEIYHVHPIVFGGSPTDPNNRIALTPEDYAQYVVWWNRKYREVVKSQNG